MFILSRPYTREDEDLEVEAILEAYSDCDELLLEFWLEYPYGAWEKIGDFTTGKLNKGEEIRYKRIQTKRKGKIQFNRLSFPR